MKTWQLMLSALVIHGLAFISVFDINFLMPITGGQTPHASPLTPPAKRLVFIVADGLRADKMLSLTPEGTTPAPFIRSIAQDKGVWGVSVTAIPTATRPGHVALTGGFYEDPSTLAKDIFGTKIDFDTVFNETRYTWTWDTPQFLDKVATDNPDHIFSKKYPSKLKYLVGAHPAEMDTWVFDEFQAFLQKGKQDEELNTKLQENKILMFLHLGGIDHAGYIVRPSSKEYQKHLKLLDDGVKKVYEEVEEFYNHDGQTAYLFTSDHGMNDWGAHGDGTPAEINCPLIAWGAGIRQALPENQLEKFQDTISEDWSLSKWKRTDIDQASMAPFMAAVIGVPFPKNAVYPVPHELFNIPDREMAEMLYANLRQLLANYVTIERAIHRGALSFSFRAFAPLSHKNIESIRTDIESLLKSESYFQAIKMIKEKITLTTQGIYHYRRYTSNAIWCATLASLLGWFVYCGITLAQQHQNWEDIKYNSPLMINTKHIIMQCAAAIIVFDLLFLIASSASITNILHLILPIPIWTATIIKYYEVGTVMPIIKRQKDLLPVAASTTLGLLMLVYSLYYRTLYGFIFVGFGMWPLIGTKREGPDALDKNLLKNWICSTIALGVLSSRPLGEREPQYNLAIISSCAAVVICLLLKRQSDKPLISIRWARNMRSKFTNFLIALIAISTVICAYNAYLLTHDQHTPFIMQATSWIIFVLALVLPLLVSTEIQSRLITVGFGFTAITILLAMGQEVLYVILMGWNMYSFIELEKNVTKPMPMMLPKLSTHEINGNYPNLPTGASNGHSLVKQHKHTKSNDILMVPQVLSEWLTYDYAKAEEHENMCKRIITAGDLRRALYFLLLCASCIYGSGYYATVSTFDTLAVVNFITISHPPSMGVLLVVKLLVPVFISACMFRASNLVTYTSIRNFSLVCMMFIALAAMIGFAQVRSTGTWTDISASMNPHILLQGVGMYYPLQAAVVYLLTQVKIM